MKGTLRCAIALAMVTGCVEWSRADVTTPDVGAVDGGSTEAAVVDGGATDAPSMDVAAMDAATDAPRTDVPTAEIPTGDTGTQDAGADVPADVVVDRPAGADVQDAGSPEDRVAPADVQTDAGMDVPAVDVPPECTTGATRSCYTGPSATAGRGICMSGTQNCVGGRWEATCPGQVLPLTTEVCGNAADDNCDGTVNEGCTLVCEAGTSNCDGMAGNGCEVAHATATNACGTATDLGTYCNDASCALLCMTTPALRTVNTVTGNRSTFFRGRIADCDAMCGGNLNAQLTLAVPAGVDYDLFVSRPCGTAAGSSATVGAGTTERITLAQTDVGGTNNSFDYVVEVRWRSGASCSPWTLTLEARSNSSTVACP